MTMWSNKRGAGKGGMPVLLHVGRARPALPDRERWAVTDWLLNAPWSAAVALALAVGISRAAETGSQMGHGRLSVDAMNNTVSIVESESPVGWRTVERTNVHYRIFDVFDVSGRRSDNVWIKNGLVFDWNQYKSVALTGTASLVLHERFQPEYPVGNNRPEFFISGNDGELPETLREAPGSPDFTSTHVLYLFEPPGILWASYGAHRELAEICEAHKSGASYFPLDLATEAGMSNPFASYGIPSRFDALNGVPPINTAMRNGMASITSGRFPRGKLVGCFVMNRSSHLDLLQLRSFDGDGKPLGQQWLRYRTRPYDQHIAAVYWPNKSGAANGSQPTRSETNSTSSAAGSRR